MKDVKFVDVISQGGVREVEGLAREIWPEYYTPIVGAAQVDYMLRQFQSAGAVNAQIQGGFQYFLIKAGDESIGYFAIVPHEKKKEIFLSKLYVRIDHRGKGIGSQVLGYIEALARTYRFTRVTLTVNKKNLLAMRFYERNGFVKIEEVVQDIGSGFVMDDGLFSKTVIDPWAATFRKQQPRFRRLVSDPAKIFLAVAMVVAAAAFVIIFLPPPKPVAPASGEINVALTPSLSGLGRAEPINIPLLGGQFVLTPVAEYKISGIVIGKHFYWPYEVWDRLSPYDVMIAWGGLAKSEDIQFIAIEHTMRDHSFKTKPLAPFDQTFLNQHATNNHIIAANSNILAAIGSIRVRQPVMLEGYLVNVLASLAQGQEEWRTSVSRNDTGPGACEVLYVTRVTANGKVYE